MGEPPERLAGWLCLVRLQKIPQCGEVLSLDETAHPLGSLGVHLHTARQSLKEARVAQLDMEVFQRAGPKRVHGGGEHFQIRPFSRRADQLNTALGNFAAAAPIGLTGAKHGLGIVKPLRQRQRTQLGSRHAGNGGGTVGPHYHNFSAAVDDFQHGLLAHGVAGADKEVIILHLWGNHLGVTPALETGDQGSLHLAPLPALGKQPVAGSLRGTHCCIQRESLPSVLLNS
ncbi:hypothetical protein SDC9_107488 [bioreactor metagenome]|uniref:Uncharacterized protein n=1 Tax=bioreactor metagenome TaxID=1076179 RepID=A0A645B6F2_9ZZZZ